MNYIENMEFAMNFVKRYIYAGDYHNLILVNKEFYSIFKYSSPFVQLNKLLYKGGWFSKFTHYVVPSIGFLLTMECLIDTLENNFNSKFYLKHTINGITRSRIKKNPNLNFINLLGY